MGIIIRQPGEYARASLVSRLREPYTSACIFKASELGEFISWVNYIRSYSTGKDLDETKILFREENRYGYHTKVYKIQAVSLDRYNVNWISNDMCNPSGRIGGDNLCYHDALSLLADVCAPYRNDNNWDLNFVNLRLTY